MKSTFAYLRIIDTDPDRESLLKNTLIDLAKMFNLALKCTYIDIEDSGDDTNRPALNDLLTIIREEIGLGEQPTVLIIAPCHLSWESSVRRRIESEIIDAGARLVSAWKNHEIGADFYP